VPDERKQFRVLYRDFLVRMVDLEILSANGDIGKLLVQFTALLAAFSLTFAMGTVSKYVTSTLPHAVLAMRAHTEEEFLIAATMAIAGLFSVLAWNTVLPTRRDCLVLGVLPVRVRTIFAAKVAAMATALGVSVTAINIFTGLYFPFIATPERAGALDTMRTFGAYWLALFAAGALVCFGLLALQGLAAQLLSYRLFLRVSGLLQLASFFGILGLFFLKPPYPNPRFDAWMPSFWFFGLFQSLNGSGGFNALAMRAVQSLALVSTIAAVTFAMAYRRSIRKIVEQPDIAPADRSRPSARVGTWLARKLLPRSIDRAILLFTARGLARSRQHRLLLAAYMGIGLAIAMAYAREYLYGPMNFDAIRLHAPWNQPNVPFLVGSLVLLFFALIGARAVFAMPIALTANWIFRVTAVHSPAAYFRAVRKSLFALAALPVWIGAGILFFGIWPPVAALQHVALMVVVGVLVVEKSLRWFRKIPFACSYLPGKANLHVRLGAYGAGFLFVADKGVELEFWTMHGATRFAVLFTILLGAALWARRRTIEAAGAKAAAIQFEDLERPELNSLDLRRDGAWSKEEAYIDRDDGGGPPASGGSGLGGGGLIGLGLRDPAPVPKEPVPLGTRIEQAFADLCYGLRVLAKAPAFSAAAVALIAMGIGGNVTIYSLVHGVLSKPAPCVRADGLVSMGVSVDGQLDAPGHSFADYVDFAAATRSMRSLAAIDPGRFTMDTPDGGRYRMRAQSISAGYFDMLGVHLAMGRTFTAAEMNGSAPLACILAYHVWENQFGRARDILGRTVLLNGQAATIVGVGERGFYGAGFAPNLEIALPLTPRDMSRSLRRLQLIGRLAPGFSIEAAQSEFDAISRRLEALYPDTNRGRRVVLAPYTATAFGPNSGRQARFFMAILTAVGMLTLLVVCANVANLMLARAATRQREMAVRLSMGASRSRVLRILFAEGLALSLPAAGGAFLSAEWATRALLRFAPALESGAQMLANLTPDWRVGMYAVLLAIASTVAFTLAPALQAWRQNLLPWLKSGEQCVIQGRSRLANLLVATQIALCFVLLTGASMTRQSLQLIDTHDLYFTKDHLLLASIDTSGVTAGGAQNLSLLERLRQRIGALSGVVSASYAIVAPPRAASGLQVESGTATLTADGNFVGPDYLETLGVPVLSGRGALETSAAGGPAMAAINRKLAEALWPGQSAVGRTIRVDGAPAQVVGVVPDGAFSAIGPGGGIAGVGKSERGNFLFVGLRAAANSPGQMILHVRYAGSFQTIAPAVREAIRQTDARVASFHIRTMDADWAELTSPVRFISALLAVFGAGSLLLAAIGLYAVASFYTARRTREFGIRLALGASPRHMQQGVLTDAMLLAGSGVVVGAALSAAAGRALGALLFGMSAADPATWVRATLLLGAVSVLAAYLPARRATKTDPMAPLRME
jgi:putative ABC transport system permease protein